MSRSHLGTAGEAWVARSRSMGRTPPFVANDGVQLRNSRGAGAMAAFRWAGIFRIQPRLGARRGETPPLVQGTDGEVVPGRTEAVPGHRTPTCRLTAIISNAARHTALVSPAGISAPASCAPDGQRGRRWAGTSRREEVLCWACGCSVSVSAPPTQGWWWRSGGWSSGQGASASAAVPP